MGFRPDPGRVGDSYSLETSHAFKADRHEFPTFWFTGDIRRRAPTVPLTPPTFKQLPIRADALGDVRARLQAIYTRHCRVRSRIEADAALAAPS